MDKKTCIICNSENLKDGIDWFDEGAQITRTQWECLDCHFVWDEPPFPGEEEIDWYEEYNSPCWKCGEIGHDGWHCPRP